MAEDKQTIQMSPEFRVSFAKVFEPKDTQNGPRYTLTAIFDAEAQKTPEFAALKQLVINKLVETWGADKAKWPKGLRNNPFKDAGEKAGEYDGFEAGSVYIECTSKYKPRIVNERVQEILNPKDFYSGCYARATLNVFAYGHQRDNQTGNKGVSFGLNDLQKLRDGKPFAGRPAVTDVFKPVEGTAAPAAEGDDSFLS